MLGHLAALRRRARFALWIAGLRLRLRRAGMRLEVEAGEPPAFHDPPALWIEGRGPGVLRLRFGRGVRLGRGTNLTVRAGGDSALTMEDGAFLEANVRLALRHGRIHLGPAAQIRDGVVLKSDGELTFGELSLISWHSAVHCHERVTVGPRTSIGERSTLVDSTHPADGTDRHHLEPAVETAPVELGANVLVLADVIVTKGARIGANSVVAARAFVGAGDHPPGHLLAGAPAEAKRPLSPSSAS